MFYVEEERKKNKEGKEEKVVIKKLISFESDGSVTFQQNNE